MKVVEIGDLKPGFSGILISASHEELRDAGRILYEDVIVSPILEDDESGSEQDVFRRILGDITDRLVAVDRRLRAEKASRKFTRDEVLALLDEIDPSDTSEGKA